MVRVTRTISFDTERDADLLAWLDAQTNMSKAVRDKLRAAIVSGPAAVTLETVYQAVLDLGSRMAIGTATAQSICGVSGDAPGTEDAANALDRLGL